MKKLNRKVFSTIFAILSVILLVGIILYNVQNYKKEYDSISRNLQFIDRVNERNNPRNNNPIMIRPNNNEIENTMIINYEVYTVRIRNNKVYRIINHSEINSNFDVESIANSIIGTENKIKIGNLYLNKYVYNYQSKNTLVIINTETINKKLNTILIESIVLFIFSEIIIYLISKVITNWSIKPATEAFNKQKDFIADASHELKTPLAVIIASSDELKSDKKNAKYVDNIKYESERMNKLITSLLDLSKLENGVSIKNYKDENISKIVEKTCLTFEAIAFENNLTIDTNIDPDIIFKCSKEEIEKLVSIIVDNAIKHSDENSVILISLLKDKNNINLEIVNKGEPIKAGDEEKIFERFYRDDKSRNRDSNRYGLGLAIAKNIVINHGGTIKALSKNGKTFFKINFKNKEH